MLATGAAAQPNAKAVADGVTLVQDINTDPKAPVVVTILRVDPTRPGVKIASALAQDRVAGDDGTRGRERLSALVARKGALAGVNADYFPYTGDPLGLCIVGGELVSEPADRCAVGITDAGEVLFDLLRFEGTLRTSSGATFPLRGLNRQRGQNELVLFTPIYGEASRAMNGVEVALAVDGLIRANVDIACTASCDAAPASGSPIRRGGAILSAQGTAADWLQSNARVGDRLTLRLDVKSDSGRSWGGVVEAVGGGPWLVRNGQVFVDAEAQGFKAQFGLVRHPRTAVGATANGELLFVAVDGRQSISRGMTLAELAELMKGLGAMNAINLDGGGSTSLSVRGIVVNSPSEGVERPVANALLVDAAQAPSASGVRFAEAGPVTLPSGEGRLLGLLEDATGLPASADALAGAVWGTTGGIGFVNQKGYFTPIKAGEGSVVALVGDCRAELPVRVVPGRPSRLTTKINPDPGGAPNRGEVVATLTDTNGNGIPGRLVQFCVKRGTADIPTCVTDEKGAARIWVTWDTFTPTGSVTASAEGIKAEAKSH